MRSTNSTPTKRAAVPPRVMAHALAVAALDAFWERLGPDGPTHADYDLMDALAAWCVAEGGPETPGGVESLANLALQAVSAPPLRVLYAAEPTDERPGLEVVVAR